MIPPYNLFYRERGIRRIQSMLAPIVKPLNVLPRDAMLHLWSLDPENKDIDTSKLYFGPSVKRILVDYPEVLTGTKGSPRKINAVIRELTRDWHNKNKRFRYLKDHYQRINDQNTLFILNYGYLQSNHRYVEMPMTAYNQWWNLQKTIFDNISAINKVSHKNHFLFMDVPDSLPSREFLTLFTDKTTNAVVKIFDNSSKLFLLELWRWFDPKKRSETIFSGLANEDLSQINLVFNVQDGRSAILNLAYINSWIKGVESSVDEFSHTSKLNVNDVRKLFLKLLMTLQATDIDQEIQQISQELPDTKKDDPADLAEDEELLAAQRDYEQDHQLDEDHVEEGEFVDAVSDFGRTGLTKTSDIKGFKQKLEKDIDVSSQLADDTSLKSKIQELDRDISSLDVIAQKSLKEKGIQLDSEGNILEEQIAVQELPVAEIKKMIFEPKSSKDILLRQVDQFADYGLISASDFKKIHSDIGNYQQSKDPYGSGQVAVTKLQVTPADIQLDTQKTTIKAPDQVIDKAMLSSTLQSFDRDYIEKVIEKDVLAMVDCIQRAGIVIKGHEIEADHSVLGSYENHALDLKPVDGVSSVIRFRVPKISSDGSFTASGNKYVMRKQRVDVPIRKIKPSIVQLSSYYGKTFVSINPKKANNALEWIVKKVNEASMESHPTIQKVYPAKVFDNHFEAPYLYNGLADNFKMVITNDNTLVFDHKERLTLFTEETVKKLETNGSRVVGKSSKGHPLVIDKSDNFFAFVNGVSVPIGDIYQVLGLDMAKAPVDFSEVRIFSNNVPVGVLLSYVIGFKNLVKLLGAKYRYVEGKRVGALEPHEFAIQFSDSSYVFDRREDRVNTLILAGFTDFHKEVKQYQEYEFDKKNVYLNLLESKGLGSIYIREIELTQQLFVDPITQGILKEMGEPETFNGLMIRATEMLQTYHHPDPQDMRVMRIRGYERIPGAIYKELVTSIRQYKNRNIAGKSRVELGPYDVWNSVMKDPAIKHIEDINPIQNLKEAEIVTYVGEGGRGKDSINKATRAYHQEDMGVVSEATVDSSDVGINAYLSANPNFSDLRGLPKKSKDINAATLLSTSALLAPGSDHDDPKRVNFVSIQQSHTIAARGYHQPIVRTGYEYVIGNRTSDMFCTTAKQDGKVVQIDDNGIIVEYKDGTKKGVALGTSYGKAEGSVYPHTIVTDLKLGQKVSQGNVIAYNRNFFEPDMFSNSNVVLKNSMTVRTVLYESNQTHEDSSAISAELSDRLNATTTKVKSYTINFNQNIREVLTPGTRVTPKSILMLIEDEITSTAGVFDSDSIASLKRLANQSPRASYVGEITKVEVYYNGDKADMSPALKSLADKSDREMSASLRASGKPVVNGQVTEEYRVGGVPLTMDKAEIRFYINVSTRAGVGDKVVFSNQLKSVIGEVMDYSMTTENGEKIDAVFGNRSIMARVTLSPYLIGTTTTLLKAIGNKAVQAYRSK